jgi:trans-aconitate 2-methyltransferase
VAVAGLLLAAQTVGMTQWQGESYRDVAQLQRSVATRTLSSLVFEGHEHVLDVGCGDGTITMQLADRLSPPGRVVGIDPSRSMIAAARELAADRPNIEFDVGDVLAMRYRREFDLVVSFNALHWVHELGLAFQRIADALVDDGRAVLQFVCAGERPSLEAVIAATCKNERWRESFRSFHQPYEHRRPGELRALTESSGLTVTRLSVDDQLWNFGSKDGFAAWCQGTFGPWTDGWPAPAKAQFISDVLDAYESVIGAPGIFRFLQAHVDAKKRPR